MTEHWLAAAKKVIACCRRTDKAHSEWREAERQERLAIAKFDRLVKQEARKQRVGA